ncbi:MAG: cell division protein ZapE [Alphaproteobacteria bacterium]
MATASNTQSSLLIAAYEALIIRDGLTDDPGQRAILMALDDIRCELATEKGEPTGFLDKLFSKSDEHPKAEVLYIWGGDGRGKSMLMDLFFTHTPLEKKKRQHFHAFMQDVHARIHELRKNRSGADPVRQLAKQMAAETRLLCFDELQAHDVADATLLFRLFDGLFNHGVTVVATSNRPPESLYTGEVQKERFDNFIHLIREHMAVATLDGPGDYRSTKEESTERRYFSPLGPAADSFISKTLSRICTEPTPAREILAVQGRNLKFSLYDGHIGRFSFADLCEKPLGAADYLAIAAHCDTIMLTDIPVLSPAKRNEAKRFVTLIDALYEGKNTVFFTAAATPERLYPEGDGAFEFKRTVSRLLEMQSEHWIRI